MKKLLMLCLLMTACSNPPNSAKPSILVTLAPYAYIVQRIAGEELNVETLIPSNSNPHIYEPSPKHLIEISNCDLWFRIGEPIETKILKVLKEKNSQFQDVNLSDVLTLFSSHVCHHHGAHAHHEDRDLHHWLSPRLMRIETKKIFQSLCTRYPDMTESFTARYENLDAELVQLDKDITLQLKPYEGQALLVSHPAFAYYCADYHLEQLSVESEGKDPLPRDVSHLLEEAKNRQVRSIFTQVQYNNKGAILIGKALKLTIHTVDPYAFNYIHNMRYITALISHD